LAALLVADQKLSSKKGGEKGRRRVEKKKRNQPSPTAHCHLPCETGLRGMEEKG
jgi:hypothetical protein